MGEERTDGTRDPAEAPDLGDRRQAQEAYHFSDKKTSRAPTDGSSTSPGEPEGSGDHRIDGPDLEG